MIIKVKVEALNEILCRRGYSKRSFASLARIGEVTAQQICRGMRNPSPPVAKKILDGLGVQFDEIFFVVSEKKSKEVIVITM